MHERVGALEAAKGTRSPAFLGKAGDLRSSRYLSDRYHCFNVPNLKKRSPLKVRRGLDPRFLRSRI